MTCILIKDIFSYHYFVFVIRNKINFLMAINDDH